MLIHTFQNFISKFYHILFINIVLFSYVFIDIMVRLVINDKLLKSKFLHLLTVSVEILHNFEIIELF